MDRLFDLFKNLGVDQIQKLLAPLVTRLLDGVDDPKDCKEHLLEMLKNGTLDDHFQQDPICVLVCIAYVVLEFVDKEHDHDHDVDPTVPIIIGDDPTVMAYAAAMDIQQPSGGPLTDALLQLVISKLLEMLQEYLDQWLS